LARRSGRRNPTRKATSTNSTLPLVAATEQTRSLVAPAWRSRSAARLNRIGHCACVSIESSRLRWQRREASHVLGFNRERKTADQGSGCASWARVQRGEA
jgi:hypothetical protein